MFSIKTEVNIKHVTYKLIKRQFKRIVECKGQEVVEDAIKSIQTLWYCGIQTASQAKEVSNISSFSLHSLGVKLESQWSHSIFTCNYMMRN